MKKGLPLLFLLLIPVYYTLASAPGIVVESTGSGSTTLRFTLPEYQLQEIITPWGTQYRVEAEGGTPILEAGSPDLPRFTTSVLIDDQGGTTISVVSAAFSELENVAIAPSKGNLYRDVKPSDVPFRRGEAYTLNTYWPATQAAADKPYIFRDYRGQAIHFMPFQYNPATRTLRIYSEITITVTSLPDKAGENIITRRRNEIRTDPEFLELYKSRFINFTQKTSLKNNYPVIPESGSMLVICHGAFMNAMEPFVQWKRQKGLEVTMVDASSAGSTPADIKTFILDFYVNNPLKYLLLVGDHAQIPAGSTGFGPSDNYYAYLDGSDSYPEIFAGRFSAEDEADVITQVERTINYEKYAAAGAAWYGKHIGIASQEGPGDDNEFDYEHIRGIGELLQQFTFTYSWELFEGSQGGNDMPGNPGPLQLSNAVNDGAGLINYTGHGSEYTSVTTGFSNSHVNNLTNTGKLPLFIAVACSNGDFLNKTCYAESWLRATHNGQPAGATGTLMSTILQSWSPPMEAQDEMAYILSGIDQGKIMRSFGAITMHGCMRMNDAYGYAGYEMTDTWVIFGDPSLTLRTAAPQPLTVNHHTHQPLGINNLSISSNTEGAQVGLYTTSGNFLGTGIISNGTVNISFSPVTTPDSILVTATAFNKTTYTGYVRVAGSIGVEETTNSTALNLYPNPSDGLQINVSLPATPVSRIEITSIEGKVVYRQRCSTNCNAGRITFEKPLPAGIYLFTATGTDGSLHRSRMIVGR